MQLTTISIGGQEYRLARQQILERVGRARAWQVERVPATTETIQRPDVRPGDIPGEYVINYIWGNGNGSIRGDVPGVVYLASDIDHSSSKRLIASGAPFEFADDTNVWGADPCSLLYFAGVWFIIAGRFAFYCSDFSGTWTTDRDFGAGHTATDAIIFNDELVVGFGGSTNKIQKRNLAGTWSTASDNTYADFFALVENRLWRATATNEVSNIGPTDNPFTLASWSSGIPIGDSSTLITDLNSIGERLAVSKETGFHLGDQSAIFPNSFPQLESIRDEDNGRSTTVMGDTILYPHRRGLIYWQPGGVPIEMGLQEIYQTVEYADAVLHGIRVTALAPQGRFVWAMIEPGLFARALPTGVRKTTDNEGTFTNATPGTTDQGLGTGLSLNALDTAGNGDYFYIGYSAVWYGAILRFSQFNINAITVAAQYWNGAAWTAFATNTPLIDDTQGLSRDGYLSWKGTLTSWAANTVDGTSAFWIRFNVSAALSAAVEISEIRVATSQPRATLWRLRPSTPTAARPHPYVWESWARFTMTRTTALAFVETLTGVFGGSRQNGRLFTIPPATIEPMLYKEIIATNVDLDRELIFPKHDGGFPQDTKDFTRLRIKGAQIAASKTVEAFYRLNENTAWTSIEVYAASPESSELVGVAGRDFQLRLLFADTPATVDPPTEVNELELVFRRRPTYKHVYTCILELSDDQQSSEGATLSPAAVQLDNLEDLQSSAPFTLIDPLGRRSGGTSGLASITSLKELEWVQENLDYPVLAVELSMAEV